MSQRKSFSEIINESDVPILVDVFMDNCGPCQAMKPVLAELKNEMGDDLRIIKINGPKNRSFIETYHVQAFPTFLLFHKGEIVWSKMGFTTGSMIKKMVKAHTAA